MKEQPENRLRIEQGTIDWPSLKARLAAAHAGVGRELTPDEKRGVLRKRAMALAEPPPSAEVAGEDLEILEFRLSYETYAIEIACIAETYPLKELTPLPCAPPFVAGIINVRGRIVSLVDLRKIFDLPGIGLTDLNKVIILKSGDMEFGILADEIIGTRSIKASEVQASLPTLNGVRAEYLKGVTRDRTALLDGARLLGDNNLVVNDRTEN